jgi:hypothetical protein
MNSISTQNETLEAARARNIADALAEDIGTGDWTAQLVPANKTAHAKLIVRQSAVLCGTDWFEGVIKALDPKAEKLLKMPTVELTSDLAVQSQHFPKHETLNISCSKSLSDESQKLLAVYFLLINDLIVM